MRIFNLLILFLIVLLADGCQSAKELHFFKSGDNYYRLKINESSIASKSRYLSGYFDESAVDKYFSEMSQPKDTVKWLTSSNRNAQLVMILSTNSNSVAEQIGNLATNEQLLENVAMLANKDKFEKGYEFAKLSAELKKVKSNIQTAGNAYIESATGETILANINDFLSNLKITAKDHLTLTNLDSAIKKFK